jgi:hypothetical protein
MTTKDGAKALVKTGGKIIETLSLRLTEKFGRGF